MSKFSPKVFLILAVLSAGLFSLPEQGLAQTLRRSDFNTARRLQPREVESEGELEVLHEDGETGSRYEYFLHTGRERLELRFGRHTPALQTGQRVRVRGRRTENVLLLASNGTESVQALSSSVLPDTFGPQRILVILVNFPDSSTPDYTIADVQPVIDEANRFYLSNSFGQTSLDVDIVGSYTINQSSAVCNYNTTAALAEEAAAAHGVNVPAYRRLIYAVPHNACASAGKGTVGGNPSRAWIHSSLIAHIWIHEIGHNFGLFHSHTKICDSSACVIEEYGDMDMMGSDPSAHFNSFQKERLGWLNHDDGVHVMPPITTIIADGVYSLGTYESQNFDPKALKILKSTDPTTGKDTYYYFEYRQPIWDNASFGYALLHSGSEDDGNSSFLLDLQPMTSAGSIIFNVGDSYKDAAGTRVSLLSEDRVGATVSIEVPPPCMAAPPTVAVSPAEIPAILPGSSLSYEVTVTNNFGASCGASEVFRLAPVVPFGWSSSLQDEILTIPSGQSVSTSLEITSSAAATQGRSYGFGVTVANRELQNHVNGGGVIVIASCTRSNPTVTLSPFGVGTISAGNSAVFSVTVTNNDSNICGRSGFNLSTKAGNGWPATVADPVLIIAPGGNASTTVRLTAPNKLRSGGYSFSVTARNRSNDRYLSSADVTVVCCGKLAVAVGVENKIYAAGRLVNVTVKVRSSQFPIARANVAVNIVKSGTAVAALTGVTDETGVAVLQYALGAAPAGKYKLNASASLNGSTGSAAASFSIK